MGPVGVSVTSDSHHVVSSSLSFHDANRTVYRKLKLYNENKEYSLNLKTRNCTVYPPRHHWHPYGAPPDAKLVFDATLGAVGVTGEYVVAAVFESSFGNDTFSVTVSEPHCFPIHSKYEGVGRNGTRELDVRDWYDGVEGIDDPDIFSIPDECKGL